MSFVDWAIVGGVLFLLLAIAIFTQRLTRSVADFLVANRSAGRYLLSVATGMVSLGAISIAANFEKFYASGFAGAWWAQIFAPIGLMMALTGFVVYRYRETRVLTMAQFFEVRYSRKFRVFAGTLAWLSGILNYGIFPAVTARFIVYFTGMPPEISISGWTFPTIAPVMLFMLGCALTIALSGGQIAVMVTDFLQGQLVNLVLIAIVAVMFLNIGWDRMIEGLLMAPEGQSRINPFDQAGVSDFNVTFFLIAAFIQVYAFRAWQGGVGYHAAARTPHEAKMAGILGEFRGMITYMVMLLVPIFMFAMMQLPGFVEEQQAVQASLATLGSAQLEKQMLVPVALSTFLPIGLMGLFAAVIVMAAVSTDDTYMHSWGSIFIQDVVMPLRKNPLSPKAHMLLLRLSIFGVALFAFWFSLLFPLHDYILMYFQITGAIYMGGAGSAILGGLYWKRGTVEGAWAGMVGGASLAAMGIFLRNLVWPYLLPGWKEAHPENTFLLGLPEQFPLNGMEMALVSALIAITLYVTFSLLSRKPAANLDQILHRGIYAVENEGHHPMEKETVVGPVPAVPSNLHGWEKFWRRIGVNQDFTRGDKAIYLFKILWTAFFFGAFLVGTVLGLAFDLPDSVWVQWWAFSTALTLVVGVISVFWFLIGGFIDLGAFIRNLRELRRDASDDGWVRKEEGEPQPSEKTP
jgi:SSS family solute:Na+ symporter